MIVSEAIDLLKEAELKQLAVKDDKIAVLGYINLGILELYKRFRLLEDTAVITVVDGTKVYTLDGNDPNVTIDLSDKTLVLIESIHDSDNLPILTNSEKETEKVKIPIYDKVYVKEPVAGDLLGVTYRAAPKFLIHEKQIIPLPPQFFEALFNYVGYRGHSSVRGDLKSENNTHYQRFDKSCANIIFNGLYIQESMETNKFEDRGFV